MKAEDFFICECGSLEHFLVFSYEPDHDDYVYVSIHLSELPFWKRLKLGILYILGHKSKYGNFEEVVLSKQKLKDMIDKLSSHYSYMVKPQQNINF